MSYRELRSKTVKCRKTHQCSWCGESIEKDEEAESRDYVWDGELRSDHQHMECAAAMRCASKDAIPADGWMPGDFLRGSTEWA